jgi:thiol-disulfide isomerase/thioredoxin
MRLAVVAAAAAIVISGVCAGQVPDFAVTSVDGAKIGFASLRGPVTVVAFISAKCPVSDAYNQRIIALYRDYSTKGVRFVFLNPNSNETADDLRKQARSAALPFPLYKDGDSRAADFFGAQTTPEFFVLDDRNEVRYHGAFDDSQNEARVRVRGLRLALDAVLGGTPVSPERIRAFGCTIHRVRHTS